jgi:ribulose-5-phosphate 4-epimerase/fuculose-1-phosphate aldolase
VLSTNPVRLAITLTSVDKGTLAASDIFEINEAGDVLTGRSRPLFEYLLHLAIVNARMRAQYCTRIPFGPRFYPSAKPLTTVLR